MDTMTCMCVYKVEGIYNANALQETCRSAVACVACVDLRDRAGRKVLTDNQIVRYEK
jgi:hypothetical protein